MKKVNEKGFTLIELLAVIVIMGILMIVAIPAISKTIENSRRGTFLDTAKEYASSVRNLWYSDGLTCGGKLSSAVEPGYYYVSIDSSNTTLLESGGKSAWGNADVKGYVLVHVQDTAVSGTVNRKVIYSVGLADSAGHGIAAPTADKDFTTLVKGDVKSVSVSQRTQPAAISGVTPVECVEN